MKKTAYLVLIIFILGFAASAHAYALYKLDGEAYMEMWDMLNPTTDAFYFSGTIGINGVDSMFGLQVGKTYEWTYGFSYFNKNHQLLGTTSHEGSVEVQRLHIDAYPSIVELTMAGDNGAQLFEGNPRWGFSWFDPEYSSEHQSAGGGSILKMEQISVPEPSILCMLALSLLGLAIFSKKMRSAMNII